MVKKRDVEIRLCSWLQNFSNRLGQSSTASNTPARTGYCAQFAVLGYSFTLNHNKVSVTLYGITFYFISSI